MSLCALKATKYTLTLINIAFGCLIAECTQCFGAIVTLGWLSESFRFLLLTNHCAKLVRSVADFLLSRSQPSAFNFYELSFVVFRMLPVVSVGWAFLGWWCFIAVFSAVRQRCRNPSDTERSPPRSPWTIDNGLYRNTAVAY